jgi:hypothetical protein
MIIKTSPPTQPVDDDPIIIFDDPLLLPDEWGPWNADPVWRSKTVTVSVEYDAAKITHEEVGRRVLEALSGQVLQYPDHTQTLWRGVACHPWNTRLTWRYEGGCLVVDDSHVV